MGKFLKNVFEMIIKFFKSDTFKEIFKKALWATIEIIIEKFRPKPDDNNEKGPSKNPKPKLSAATLDGGYVASGVDVATEYQSPSTSMAFIKVS